MVQGSLSSQRKLPEQCPSRSPHTSPVVHGSLSLQGVPAGRKRATRQLPARHSSILQSPTGRVTAGSARHSSILQSLDPLVSQLVPLGTEVLTQPRAISHLSNVHTLWSSHRELSGICRHASGSLTQTSCVHAKPSLQSFGAPPMQFPPL